MIALFISAGYYALAARIPASRLADGVGPEGLPKAYALMLGTLALIVIGRSLAARRTAPPSPAQTVADSAGLSAAARRVSAARRGGRRSESWRVVGMLAIGVGYIIVVPWLGYVVSLAGLIFATTYYQGGTVSRQVAIVAVSGAVFCWMLFVLLMRIPQPPGLWPSLFQ
jgi:putative tricarboxylic transport membrane protein